MSTENEQCEHTKPGTIGWNELVTPNHSSSIAFYAALFGWEREEMPLPDGGTYTLLKQGPNPVAGCYEIDGDNPAMWLSYINVEDLNATLYQAKQLGATVCKERVDLPMGSFAVITDPQGATIAFWQCNDDCA